jgi:hypothetical protein
MTTYAPDDTDRLLEELAEREREAWFAYSQSLSGLVGRLYEDAEAEAWDELQHVLHDISSERTQLSPLLAPPRS